MGVIVVELTNRCNLACGHCLPGRHGGGEHLPLEALSAVLRDGAALGFDRLSFTGGEPTMHPQFGEVLRRTDEAGYRFGIVTNGWNFGSVYAKLLEHRNALTAITFSLDGATEAAHDRLRGAGSYRRVLKAFSICVAMEIPFTINMSITGWNRDELEPMAALAAKLGSAGLRYGHLMTSPRSSERGLDLTPEERKAVEAEIRRFAPLHSVPIGIAPGYHTHALFPCDPLAMREVNLDCRGRLTKCCHLSGHGDHLETGGDAAVGAVTFAAALGQLEDDNGRFRAEKSRRQEEGLLQDSDFFPCWYCAVYHGQADWVRDASRHSWRTLIQIAGQRKNGDNTAC